MKLTKSQVARLGALARMKKYGNPGTIEGRRKGGANSVLSNIKLDNNFKTAKDYTKPRNSKHLAEFMGILIGDGHLSNYQAEVTTNSETDIEHAGYIEQLIKKLFSIEAALIFRKKVKAVSVVVSSVNLVNWLTAKGMPKGNKLDQGLSIPKWIVGNRAYEQSFIRGLFDTDGCVYMDKHVIKGRMYENQGWVITSYSNRLRSDVLDVLRGLGYRPTTTKTQKSVYMRRRVDIERYFKEIGTSNSKHLGRYLNGRVR